MVSIAEIKKMNDKELETFVETKIRKLEKKAKEENGGNDKIMGYNLNYNPKDYYIDQENINTFEIDSRCIYKGFLKKGMKVVYQYSFDYNCIVSNDGGYYYIDDESYIIDFLRKIRDIDIEDDYELFQYLLKYITDYFGLVNKLSRSELFSMIHKDERRYYKPINEHKLTDIKDRAVGMCTEYSLMAQNILSVLDFETYLVFGVLKSKEENGSRHAFNLIAYDELEGETAALIDFANSVNIYNIKNEKIGIAPYIIYLDRIDEEFIKNFYEDMKVIENEYAYLKMDNTTAQLLYPNEREYYLEKDYDEVVRVSDNKVYYK